MFQYLSYLAPKLRSESEPRNQSALAWQGRGELSRNGCRGSRVVPADRRCVDPPESARRFTGRVAGLRREGVRVRGHIQTGPIEDIGKLRAD